MAITKKYKNILTELIKTKSDFTLKELEEILGVSHTWIPRNKSELESMGFVIAKDKRKDTGVTRRKYNSRVNKVNLDVPLTNLTYYNNLLLKVYINKAYVFHGLVAPFQVEYKEYRNTYISTEDLEYIEARITSENFDYKELLIKLVECQESYSPLYHTNFPVNIFVYLKTLYDSLPLLRPIEISPDTLLIINNTFQDLFGFYPSEEQLQVVAKSLRYASSDMNYGSASIQSDAGSSKSCCAVVIQTILRPNLNPLIVAKTNKAIVGMQNARTIAKFLQENVGLSVTKDTWEERKLKAFQKQDCVDFLIVDESSQVGELDRIILQTVCKKVLYFGDKEQTKPIHDRQAIDTVFLHTLKHQYRFDKSTTLHDGVPFQSVYTLLNKEKRKETLSTLFDTIVIGNIHTKGFYSYENGDYLLKNSYEDSFNAYSELLDQYANDDSIVIAYSQSAVDAVNVLMNGGNEFKVGSKVCLKFNDYENEQYNGYQYRIIEELSNGSFICKSIENDSVYEFKPYWITLAYAITTMTSQGSQWKHVLGIDRTCPNLELWTDRYVIITRAAETIKFLSSCGFSNSDNISLSFDNSSTTKLTVKSVLNLYNSKASIGNRNNLLYGCYKDLIKIDADSEAFEELRVSALASGLSAEEVDNIFIGRNNLILNSLSVNTVQRNTLWYTPVFHSGKTLPGPKRVLTYEEVSQQQSLNYIAEELKGGVRIVIDCDSKQTVELFSHYIDKTECYINEDKSSAHFVFTTDKIVPTKHKDKLDLLGNEKYSLRNIKPNKVGNNKDPLPLDQKVLDLFNGL